MTTNKALLKKKTEALLESLKRDQHETETRIKAAERLLAELQGEDVRYLSIPYASFSSTSEVLTGQVSLLVDASEA